MAPTYVGNLELIAPSRSKVHEKSPRVTRAPTAKINENMANIRESAQTLLSVIQDVVLTRGTTVAELMTVADLFLSLSAL